MKLVSKKKKKKKTFTARCWKKLFSAKNKRAGVGHRIEFPIIFFINRTNCMHIKPNRNQKKNKKIPNSHVKNNNKSDTLDALIKHNSLLSL